MRIFAWLCICGGIATSGYVVHAFLIGEVVISSRGAGTSIYRLSTHPGPFYGFLAFYVVCAAFFVTIGLISLRRKNRQL